MLAPAWGDSDFSTSGSNVAFGPASLAAFNAAASTSLSDTTFIGGVQAGYNSQFSNVVVGLEGDINSFRLQDSASSGPYVFPSSGTIGDTETTMDAQWLATLRGRIGFTYDSLLIYATAGVANANLKYTQTTNNLTTGAFESVTFTNQLGWTVGVGGEWALDKNWSVKAEYLYLDFGSTSAPGFFSNAPGFPNNHSADLTTDIARLGINYRM